MLDIKATNKTPNIKFNEGDRKLTIKGRSIHEDPKAHYEGLFHFINEFIEKKEPSITVHFELSYFNSSSAIVFRDLIRILNESPVDVNIDWYYESDDDEMKASGEEFDQLFPSIQFNFNVC